MDTKNLNQTTLRTKKTQKEYMEYLENSYTGHCLFCAKDLLIQEYDLWLLVKNKFPYDRCYTDHYMLAPKRHVSELYELTKEEHAELDKLFDEIPHNQAILNKRADRSVPAHFHWHILTIK